MALLCETIICEPPLDPKDIKRENIQCKLTYVAFGMNKIYSIGFSYRTNSRTESSNFYFS